MKFFITGSTGFIGGTLSEHYSKDHDVSEYRRGEDVVDSLDQAQPDVIINCAGEIYNPDYMYNTNIVMVQAILEWLKNHPSTRLIHIGSSSEYGMMTRAARETDPINPIDVYQATKGAGTLLCRGYARQFGLQTLVARIYSGYGAKERPHRLFPRLYRAFFEKEAMTLFDGYHDFIYIDDFVRGIDLMLTTWRLAPGEIVNFGSATQISNFDLLTVWEMITNKTAPVAKVSELKKAFENNIWVCDPAKSDRLGFVCEYNLENGIRNFLEKASY